MNWIYLLFTSLLFVGCGASSGKQQVVKTVEKTPVVVEPAVVVPIFDADSAYSFIETQVNFGPRVPSTTSHRQCGDYLISKFEGYGALEHRLRSCGTQA